MRLTESNLIGGAIRILLFLLPLLAVATHAQAGRLPIKAYTTADGLANNRIGRILRDSHGFMWFCTANGLSRFDGSRFKTFNVEDGLPNSSSYDLLETRDGNYWVATNGGGVARFHFTGGFRPMNQGESASRFTVYSIGDNPVSNRVNNLFEDKAGVLWPEPMADSSA
jgi:ligand-binding sensor domain-containing protein